MGIYIEGMEMPFTCLNCDFHKCAGGVGDFCSLTKRRQFRFKNRPKDCPLIEVPEPHGRLIDAQKIGLTNFEIILCQKGNPFKNALEMLFEKIDATPTIIPAEPPKEVCNCDS